MQIRDASAADSEAINQVILGAKAHWGYSADQMQQWRASLLPTAESIAAWPTFVAELDGQIVGIAQVDPTATPWELTSCWVRPGFMRLGIGTALLARAAALASGRSQSVLHIDSDPNAEQFYLAQGAIRVGVVAAPISGNPGRIRPQLRLSTQRGPTPRSSEAPTPGHQGAV